MILQDIKELKMGERDLRKFGLLVGGVFAALGLWFWLRHKPAFPYFLCPGLVLVALGTLHPRSLKLFYIAWMSVGITLGFVVSNVILVLFFVVVITPIGLTSRLFGKDFLNLRLDRQAATYWIPREQKRVKADYEKQF